MLPSEALAQARELVARGWCRGAAARDDAGGAVDPWHEGARSWSVVGAVAAVAERAGGEPAELAELEEAAASALALAVHVPRDALARWNDDPQRTHEDAVAAYDAAIALVPQLVVAHIAGGRAAGATGTPAAQAGTAGRHDERSGEVLR